MSMRKYGASSFKRPMTEEKEMSEVKRIAVQYDPICEWLKLVECEGGDLVNYDDYAALKAERDKLAAENLALKILADACSLEYESAATQGCGDDEKVAYPEDSCNITFGMIRRAIKTPATDAYANQLRAEGAEACGVHLREWYDYQVEQRSEAFAANLRKENGHG